MSVERSSVPTQYCEKIEWLLTIIRKRDPVWLDDFKFRMNIQTTAATGSRLKAESNISAGLISLQKGQAR